MALTKVTNTGIADDAVTTDKIEDGTVLAADIAPGTVPATKLASTLDLSSKSVTLASGEISNAELANSSITLNGSSVSLGGSGTVKHIDWQAVTVADGSTTLNTTAGKGYFLDTNAGVIEVFLPSSPTRGDTVVLADYSGTFATNQIIINTGGELLDSTAGNDFKVTTNNSIVELVYVDAAKGWLVKLNQAAGTTPDSALTGYQSSYDTEFPYIQATGGTITTSGDYKIHTFTGDGCFVVSKAGLGTSAIPSIVDYLVVAGGGAGSPNVAAGGGAGGFREGKAATSPTHTASPHTASPLAATSGITVTTTTYPITVGAGGAGAPSYPEISPNGSNSVFSTITSAGGGKGGCASCGGPVGAGLPGGSGGGAGGNTGGPVGSGNTPPTSPPQGNPGGSAATGFPAIGAGGGGGATAAGNNGTPTVGGDGGAGATTLISGSPTAYAGGGGGQAYSGTQGTGGIGGGGPAGPAGPSRDGTANTGGGGGASAGSGGKGIVVIRYKFQ